MKKRQFLGGAALAGLLPAPGHAAPAAARARGPALLTITGAVGKVNRGPFDPLRDQMMHKQKLTFDKAYTFDFAALSALPAVTIAPTLEYDAKAHTLRGPALLDVLKAAGVAAGDASGDAPGANIKLVLRAVDGYAASITLAQARARRFILATHLDGAPMALGGLGPLWAIHDADRLPEIAAKPLGERFGDCPWALYHIEVA